jgi:hypothetical protein
MHGSPAWVDPMLEELAASLGCSPALRAASQESDASLVGTRSPTKTALWTMDSPPLSPMQPSGGQPDVMDVEAQRVPALVRAATPGATVVAATVAVNLTPSPQTTSANRLLKSFTERVTKSR